jgi:hypothetical protein
VGTTAKWYQWDVTAYLLAAKATGRTTVTLVLRNPAISDSWCVFNSDEATSNRPELLFT